MGKLLSYAWEKIVSQKGYLKKLKSMPNVVKRVKQLCQQGQYGREAKTLYLEGIAPDDEGVLGALQKLHPYQDENPKCQPDNSEAFQFD